MQRIDATLGYALPGRAFTQTSAAMAKAEADALVDLASRACWQQLEAGQRLERAKQRQRLLLAKDAEALEGTQDRLRSTTVAREVMDERIGLAARALDTKRIEQPVAIRGDFKEPGSARTAIRMAEAAAEMVKTLGWAVLVQHMVARAWAHAVMMDDCDGEAARAHRAWICGCRDFLREVQTRIDLGCDAEVWLDAQARRVWRQRNRSRTMPEGVKDTQGAVAGGGPAGGGTPEVTGGAAVRATGGGGGTGPAEGTPQTTDGTDWKQRVADMQGEFDSRGTKLKEMADYDELKQKAQKDEEAYGSLDDVPEGGTVAAEPAAATTPPDGTTTAPIQWQRWAEGAFEEVRESQGMLAAIRFAQEVQTKGLADLGIPMPAGTQPKGQQATASGLTRADVEQLLADRDAKRTAEQFASARLYDRQVRELTDQLGEDFLKAECEVGGEKMTREEAVEVYCVQKGASAEAAVMDLFQGHYIETLAGKRAQALVAERDKLIAAGQLPSGPAAFSQAPPPNAELDAQVAGLGDDGVTTERPDWVPGVVAAPRV